VSSRNYFPLLIVEPSLQMAQSTVYVRGKPQVISVYQKAQRDWIAVGDYMGQIIAVNDSVSASDAAKEWAEAVSLSPHHSARL
jgi:hypothetical protein